MPLYQPRALPPHSRLIAAWAKQAGIVCGYLVGGALRDADNDRPIRDYDVFVETPKGESPSTVFARLSGVTDNHTRSGDRYQFKLPVPDGTTIDIDLNFFSRLHSPETQAGSAPVGISGIVMDLSDGKVYATHSYTKDVAAKTIGLLGGGEDDIEAMQHADKVQAKYGWPIVDSWSGRLIRPALAVPVISDRTLTPVS
jgi:hypothetical protein